MTLSVLYKPKQRARDGDHVAVNRVQFFHLHQFLILGRKEVVARFA